MNTIITANFNICKHSIEIIIDLKFFNFELILDNDLWYFVSVDFINFTVHCKSA